MALGLPEDPRKPATPPKADPAPPAKPDTATPLKPDPPPPPRPPETAPTPRAESRRETPPPKPPADARPTWIPAGHAEAPAPSAPATGAARRRTIGVSVVVYVLAAVVVWASIAAITAWYGRESWDVTHIRQFTLAPETIDLLKRLNKPLRITSVFPVRGDSSQQALEEIETLLDLFEGQTRWIERRRIDSDRDPAAARELIERLKLDPNKTLWGVAFEYGERSRLVPRDRIVEFEEVRDHRRVSLREKAFHGESAFASAILNLLEEATPKVDLVAGHGELDPENPGKEGFLYAKTTLLEERLDVRQRFLVEAGEIPPDTDVVVVAGPIEPYEPREVATISAFLERGGGLLVIQGPQRRTGLEPMLAKYGIAYGDDVVIDPVGAAVGATAMSIYVQEKGKHPITNQLGQALVLIPSSRSVIAKQAPSLPLRLERTELLFSSPKSWAETDFTRPPKFEADKGDRRGPISLGVAAAVPPDPSDPKSAQLGGTRIVAYGSREAFTNTYIQRAFGNEDLFQNSVNWLAKRDRLASVRPRTPDVRPLNLTKNQAFWLALGAYLGPSTVFLMMLVAIAWRRRA